MRQSTSIENQMLLDLKNGQALTQPVGRHVPGSHRQRDRHMYLTQVKIRAINCTRQRGQCIPFALKWRNNRYKGNITFVFAR